MNSSYRLTPKLKHYSCMVDLLARVGQLYEVWDFIEKMPEKLDEIVQGHYLVFVKSVKILMLVRRWDDSAKMRVLMRQKGVNKTPGCSWIEIEAKLHEFLAGYDFQYHSIEIHQVFELLNVEMKREGYIPKVD
ncbi:hypothetical protein REPUB_Repub07fG0131700 [Reevesia pubescens]